MDYSDMNTPGSNSGWTGKDSIKITIPELKRIDFLVFLETVCIGVSTVILFLSIMVFVLSYGYERSDLGSIIFAGTSLILFLIIVVVTDIKLNKTVRLVDAKFNEAIFKQLGLKALDKASIAHKKAGYMYLTDNGSKVTMWEIFYYNDQTELVSLERYIPENHRDDVPDDESIKAA